MSNLSVIVIGGGIGGLTVAIALRRAGHKVTVYEKYSLAGELGAAIGLGPNVMDYLQSLGFDNARAQACDTQDSQFLDGRTLELLQVLSLGGSGTATLFRPDLRKELRYLAEEEGNGRGPPCLLVEFAQVAGIEPEQGIVRFNDGSQESADLVIAADGVNSSAMDLVLGEPSPASRSNTTAARAVIPVQKLQQNPFARIVASVPGRSTFSLSPDRRRYLLAYWCHGFEYINLVLYATDDIPGMVLDTMRGETTRRDVAAALEQFHPDLGTVCDHLLDVLPLWRQHTRAPAPRYTRGRLVVIGDAAHAMLSHRGQGANAAILDAAALGALFTDMPEISAEQVLLRLGIYDKVRVPRVSATQIWSESPMFEEPSKKNEEVKVFLPDVQLPESTSDLLKWWYKYDVVQDCRERLQERLQENNTNI